MSTERIALWRADTRCSARVPGKESGGISGGRVSCHTAGTKFLFFLAFAAVVATTVAPVLAQPTVLPFLVAAVPLPGAPDGAHAYRIVYHSTDGGGAAIDVTGVVILPAGPA